MFATDQLYNCIGTSKVCVQVNAALGAGARCPLRQVRCLGETAPVLSYCDFPMP